MNVIAFKPKERRPEKGGATLFFHVRQTTLIAHLAAPRRHRQLERAKRQSSSNLK